MPSSHRPEPRDDRKPIAERFNVSLKTVTRWIESGDLEASCLGRGIWVIPKGAEDRLIALRSNRPVTRRRARRRAPRGAVTAPGRRGTLVVTADMGRR